tara:strand:- start:61 stop:213 length:153 start_codon:yes stop_codon:yes gene_type:complete
MDFKTFKIKIMNRKFEHTDLVMIGGVVTIIGLIVFSATTYGFGDSYVFMF